MWIFPFYPRVSIPWEYLVYQNSEFHFLQYLQERQQFLFSTLFVLSFHLLMAKEISKLGSYHLFQMMILYQIMISLVCLFFSFVRVPIQEQHYLLGPLQFSLVYLFFSFLQAPFQQQHPQLDRLQFYLVCLFFSYPQAPFK